MTYHFKISATAALLWSFASLGLLIASLGPSFLALTKQTKTTHALLSFAFTARSLGYLAGSACGGVLLDMMPHRGHKIIASSLFFAGVASLGIPVASNIWLLSVLVSTQGLAMGALDTIGNIIIIALHSNEGKKMGGGKTIKSCSECNSADPFMQALHCSFALGALLAPLLVRRSMEHGGDISFAFFTFAAITGLGAIAFTLLPTPPQKSFISPCPQIKEDNGGVELSEEWHDEHADNADSNRLLEAESAARPGPRTWHSSEEGQIVLKTALLLGLCVGAEVSCGGLITLYATTGDCQLSEAEGQYLAAIFWGCLTVGRLLAVPLSFTLSAASILAADVIVCVLALILFLVHAVAAAEGHFSLSCKLFYCATATLGFGLASMFPTALMQAETLIRRSNSTGSGGGGLSGRSTSVIMVGSATGEMLVPVIIGVWTAAAPKGFIFGLASTTALFSAAGLGLILQ